MFFVKTICFFIVAAVLFECFSSAAGEEKKTPDGDKWASLRPYLNRKYILSKNCDPVTFDKMLEGFGNKDVGSRKALSRLNFVFALSLEKDGEVYWVKVIPGRQTFEKITLDQPIERETPDNREVTSVYTIEGNVLKETQTWHCGKRSGVILRRFTEDEMILTTQVNDVNCDRVFRFAGMAEPVPPPTKPPPNPEA